MILLCDDAILDTFAFLSRPKLCQLEFVSLHWHNIIANYSNVLYIVESRIYLLPLTSSNPDRKVCVYLVEHFQKTLCSQLGYYAFNHEKAKLEKWRLPNPPRFIRCIHVVIKYTAAVMVDYLHENGHIFQYPSTAAAFGSYSEIYVDLKVFFSKKFEFQNYKI